MRWWTPYFRATLGVFAILAVALACEVRADELSNLYLCTHEVRVDATIGKAEVCVRNSCGKFYLTGAIIERNSTLIMYERGGLEFGLHFMDGQKNTATYYLIDSGKEDTRLSGVCEVKERLSS